MSTLSLPLVGGGRDAVLALLAVGLPPLALAVSFVSPLWAYALALGSLYASGHQPRVRLLACLVFAHAGALVFASRDLSSVSSDFQNYFASFQSSCAPAFAGDDGASFGVEVGLSFIYRVLASLGACHLSIEGLAWLQGFGVSALLLVQGARIVAHTSKERDFAALLAGLGIFFSFFYVTQLSRQALSSVFLIEALWLARGKGRVTLALSLATVCHLTAPLVFGVVWLLRRFGWRGIATVVVLALLLRVYIGDISQFAFQTDFAGLEKLAFYAGTDEDAAAGSDLGTVLLLSGAAAPLLWRGGKRGEWRQDARMLFGLAAVGLVLLPLPLAATRFLVLFASFLGGLFVLRGVTAWSRAAATATVLVLGLLRVALFATAPGGTEHALWTSFGASSLLPGYFLPEFVR
jgi:hypothetical protein